jgi:anti-anti-sigma regulatory factor
VAASKLERELPRRYPVPLNIRIEDDVVVLGNFSRLMNDPRYVDAGRDIQDLLDQGHRKFILDLGGVRETGSSFLGLLMTVTRRIRQNDGEAVAAHVNRETEKFFEEMRMDDFWDVFANVQEAIEFFRRQPEELNREEPD